MSVNETLLSHAIDGWCEDNDCELHRIEVAIAEEVVEPANVAFWLAGWDAAVHYIATAMGEVVDEVLGEGRSRTKITPDHSQKV